MTRANDPEMSRVHFQSDRFFAVANDWYFATREAGDQGPYPTRERAQNALAEYLRSEVGVETTGWDVPGAHN